MGTILGYSTTPSSGFNWSGYNTQNLIFQAVGNPAVQGYITDLYVYMGGFNGGNPSTILFCDYWDGSTHQIVYQSAAFFPGTSPAWQHVSVPGTTNVIYPATRYGVGFWRDPTVNGARWDWDSVGGADGWWDVEQASMGTFPGGSHDGSGQDIGAYLVYTPSGSTGGGGSAYVYRSGVWTVATGISVYRSGAWSGASSINVRRSGVWTPGG